MRQSPNEHINHTLEYNKGILPSLSSIGGYPIFYLDNEDRVYCSECGTKNIEKIILSEIHWEGQSIHCDECDVEIESAYGNPYEDEI